MGVFRDAVLDQGARGTVGERVRDRISPSASIWVTSAVACRLVDRTWAKACVVLVKRSIKWRSQFERSTNALRPRSDEEDRVIPNVAPETQACSAPRVVRYYDFDLSIDRNACANVDIDKEDHSPADEGAT